MLPCSTAAVRNTALTQALGLIFTSCVKTLCAPVSSAILWSSPSVVAFWWLRFKRTASSYKSKAGTIHVEEKLVFSIRIRRGWNERENTASNVAVPIRVSPALGDLLAVSPAFQ